MAHCAYIATCAIFSGSHTQCLFSYFRYTHSCHQTVLYLRLSIISNSVFKSLVSSLLHLLLLSTWTPFISIFLHRLNCYSYNSCKQEPIFWAEKLCTLKNSSVGRLSVSDSTSLEMALLHSNVHSSRVKGRRRTSSWREWQDNYDLWN